MKPGHPHLQNASKNDFLSEIALVSVFDTNIRIKLSHNSVDHNCVSSELS